MTSPSPLEQCLKSLYPLVIGGGKLIASFGAVSFLGLLPVALAASEEQLFWLSVGLIGAVFSPVGWLEQVSKSGVGLIVAFPIGLTLTGLLIMAVGSILDLIQLELAASRRRKNESARSSSPSNAASSDDTKANGPLSIDSRPYAPACDEEDSGHPS